jgi:histidine ammonia-lyase
MGTEEAYRIIRDRITTLENDRIMYTDINMAEEIVQSWEIVSQVESKVGELR